MGKSILTEIIKTQNNKKLINNNKQNISDKIYYFKGKQPRLLIKVFKLN